jgi:hypothetical protein
MTSQHVEVKSLAPAVQAALASVNYGACDIEIIAADSVEFSGVANDGQRAFTMAVNLATGEHQRHTGLWGGSNMFTQSPVDDGAGRVPIPPHGVVVKGTLGYPRTFARIYTTALGKFLPAPEVPTTTDAEQQALYCFAAIKGGEYRRDEMRRRGVTEVTVEALIERGYLKRNSAGATAITTAGKNARDRSRAR